MEIIKKNLVDLWMRECYVATVRNVNEATIRNYIQKQEENDKLEESNW